MNVNKIIYKIIGYILLTPALVSVLIFFTPFFTKLDFAKASINDKYYLIFWRGMIHNRPDQDIGYLAFYLTLMALVGAYLIKDNK